MIKLVIASGKGGVGKSMLTSTLSMLFSKTRRVVAVDCDVDAPNLNIWLGGVKKWDKIIPVVTSARPEIDYDKCNGCEICAKNCRFSALEMKDGKPQLNPFLCEGCGACEIICPQKAITLKPVQNGEIRVREIKRGFTLVSGQLYPGETGSGKVVAEIKKEASNIMNNPAFAKATAGKVMLIDSAPGTGCPVIASLQDSDFAILVTEPTPSGLSDLKRVLKVVEHFKIPWGLVINKWDINPELSKKTGIFFKNKLLGKISYDKKIFTEISKLNPILKTKLKAKTEINEIFNNLNSKLK
jgi:MinD superfamily P-loop ATPase